MSGTRPFILAIDGPAGAGKSTAARRLAEALGFALVDTGAIYRAVALAASRVGIAFDDDTGLGALLPSLDIRFAPPFAGAPDAGQRVFLGGEDVSRAIRTPPISLGASAVSARPVVRAGLLELQRRLAVAEGNRGAVLEGRDIGTVVFPNAELKIFLDASPEVRAERRWKEHQEKGDVLTLEQVVDEVQQRDRRDRERAVSPLVRAKDAVLVDNTAMGIEETARAIVLLAREREKEFTRAAGKES